MTVSPTARYGAIAFHESTSLANNIFAYNVLTNASAVHGAPVYMNLADTAILRTLPLGATSR